MLDKTGTRQLAYVVKVDAIEPIEGKDRVECAVIGGWRTMVRKNQFKPGDLGIYFEIDSKVPETEPFKFLEKYHYKIKTQKFKNFYSQGLLMHPSDFGGVQYQDGDGQFYIHFDKNSYLKENCDYGVHEFLTEKLGVIYAVADDNKRKAPSSDKYKKMAQRHPSLFKKSGFRWLMKRNWGKKLLFIFFGKAKDKRSGWPSWVVKTDEERCQNMPWLFTSEDWYNTEWIATEKIDGTSTTFTMKRNRGLKKNEYYVCSRNVCFDTPSKSEKCFYDSNVYLEMSEKYHIKDILQILLDKDKKLKYITIQGETYGDGIQKRTYSVPSGHHALMVFNLIYGYEDGSRRLNPIEMTKVLSNYGIPCVPIVAEVFKLPKDCDTLLIMATGESALDDKKREGLVFRDRRGERSFKAVSNEFLMEYHQ